MALVARSVVSRFKNRNHTSSYASKKPSAPFKMGSERPNHRRHFFKKPRRKRRQQVKIQFKHRSLARKSMRKLRRKSVYYTNPRRKTPLRSSCISLVRRYRFDTKHFSRQLRSTAALTRGVRTILGRYQRRLILDRLVQACASSRVLRLRHFLVSRAQPTFKRGVSRRRVSRKSAAEVIFSARKLVQPLVTRRLSYDARFTREAVYTRRRSLARMHRVFAFGRGYSFRTRATLRLSRLLSSTVAASEISRLSSRVSQARGRVGHAVQRRLRRYHVKAVIASRPVKCGKCSNCKKSKRCLRLKYASARRGRRGYAGMFGKRRWRVGRRDRRLLRRAVRRFTLRQAFFARAVASNSLRHVTDLRNRRYTRAAYKQTFAASALLPAVTTLLRTRSAAHKKSRGLLYRNYLRRLERSYTLPRKHLGKSRHASASVAPRRVTHTSAPRLRRNKCVMAPHVSLCLDAVTPIPEATAFLDWRIKENTLLQSTPEVAALYRKHRNVVLDAPAPVLLPTLNLDAPRLELSVPPLKPLSNKMEIAKRAEFLPLLSRAYRRSFLVTRRSTQPEGARAAHPRGAFALWTQRKRFKEQQFYRKRLKLRLPLTAATRGRRRKGGFGLFAQNSLKAPQSAAGLRGLLLPPHIIFDQVQRRTTLLTSMRPNDLRRVKQRIDVFPRHWTRLPRWIDLKPLFWVQRAAATRMRRKKFNRARATYRKSRKGASSAALVRSASAGAVFRKNSDAVNESVGSCTASAQRTTYVAALARSKARVLRGKRQAITKNIISRLLGTRATSSTAKRRAGVWHARSVRSARYFERALSAWSPQYQTRSRRWASPRQDGVLLRRTWPSRRLIRERASTNASLMSKHKPRQMHWDRGFIHLQYYLGSAASVGYDRLRRTHRLHSRFSRWWKPVNRPVPFPHPFSRRTLNAKRYYRNTMDGASLPKKSGLAGRSTRVGASGERTQRHMPSRQIPWRNFNYPAPRRGAPATIQRWTMRSLGRSKLVVLPNKAKTSTLVLTRRLRELRRLELAIPSSKVWADHQWKALDPAVKTSLESSQLMNIFRRVPSSVWASLRARAHSLSHYAKLQNTILRNYRQWGAHTFGSMSAVLAGEQLRLATAHLLRLIKLALSASENYHYATATDIALNQQRLARASAMSQKIMFKRALFWDHRELPSLQQNISSLDANPLRRENSTIYKHWLHGAERYLKQSQYAYTPAARSRYSSNYSKNFGRRRLRFPASGRRRRSYDSMLHAFAKKVSPARFRRTSVLRFTRGVPMLTGDFRQNVVISNVSSALQRQRLLARKLNRPSAPSRAWRELLSYRATPAKDSVPAASVQLSPKVPGFATKRRFASLPINAVAAHKLRTGLNLHRALPYALRAVRVGILRKALRRRRKERAFLDLRSSALHRRAPKERAVRPWKLKRRARARLAARSRMWRRPKEAKRVISWGLSHLSAKGTKPANRALLSQKAYPSGELLLLPSQYLRRDRRALRGFSVIVPRRRRRLRKKLRDSRKGRRGHRRRRFLTPLGAMVMKTHWSEGRELKRLRRIGRRDSAAMVRRFISPLPRLFFNLYGGRRNKQLKNLRDRGASIALRASALDTYSATKLHQKCSRESDNVALSTTALHRFSSLRRRKRLRKMFRRMRTRVARVFASRKFRPLFSRRVRRRVARTQRARTTRWLSAYVGRKFVASPTELRSPTPLWFQNPTDKIVKSEAAKKRELEAGIASKEARYKFTAQYIQNLTLFIPELINYMVSRKIIYNGEKITATTAQHLIRNIYWSLRIYLNVDPFDNRFTLRDQNPATRVRMAKLMEDLSAEQTTEQPQRAALRFRLQPGRIIRVRNKLRFRGDWLRNFLPAQHALYLENADEYGLFLLKTNRITRLRYGTNGIATWKTTTRENNQETRARQLLSLRYSKATPRFETMLQGTRRLPQVECRPVLQSGAGRLSFFARPFSTQKGRSSASVVGWLRRQRRFAFMEGAMEAPSPYLAVTTRYRVLSRIEARGKTNFVGAARPSMLPSFLDVRAVRAKSPRSRQYLLRTSTSVLPSALPRQLSLLRNRRRILARLLPTDSSTRWTRLARRFVRTRPIHQSTNPVSSSGGVSRLLFNRRRTPSRMQSKQFGQTLLRRSARNFAFTNRRTVNVVSWRARRVWPDKTSAAVRTSQHILRSNSAAQRSEVRQYRAPLILLPDPVRLRARFADRLHTVARASKQHMEEVVQRDQRGDKLAGERVSALYKFMPSTLKRGRVFAYQLHCQKALKTAQDSLGSRLATLRKAIVSYLTRSKHTPLSVQCKRELAELWKKVARILTRAPREISHYKQLIDIYEETADSTIASDRAAYMAHHRALSDLEAFIKQYPREDALSYTRIAQDSKLPYTLRSGHAPHFFVYGGARLSSFSALAELCAEVVDARRQSAFDNYRTRLWDKLTLRRAKRQRVARYWIKETGRWMRDPWIAGIVNLEMRSRPGLLAGELRAREQQIGEYVADVDARGRDIPLGEEDAPLSGAGQFRARFRERHEYAPRPQPKLTELARVKRARGVLRGFVSQRLQISKVLRKKPIPMMWLANYEYNDFWREFKADKAKSREQKAEEAKTKQQETLARAARGLAPIRERRYALKMPPLPKLPKLIWKEIHRRVRRLEWRESDEVFFRRGFRNAFRFYPQERNRAPWLEALMYTRATYSTRLREFRRRAFPREQKKYKWLQRVRKMLFPTRTTRYIKRRKWTQLKIYNQRLHYSLFNICDRSAARRHFRKLNRRSRPQISSFVDASRGLGDRVDVTLLHLKVVPSIFWARVVSPFGLLRVNGVLIKDPAYRLQPADVVHLEWDRIARFQHFFEPKLRRREDHQRRARRRSTSAYPTNFEYHRGTRTLLYKHAPDEADLRKSNRLRANYFRWFKLDSL